jgi:hypothetical protein
LIETLPGEGGVLHLGEGLDPVDALAVLAPERLGVVDRLRVGVLVFRVVDIGALGPFGADGVDFLGHAFLPVNKRDRDDRRAADVLKLRGALCDLARAEQARPASHFGRGTFGGQPH